MSLIGLVTATETGPPRLTSYEADAVALEKQLEGTRITRKGDSLTQVAPPSSEMVAGGKQGQPLYPVKHALQIFTEGWGAHLNKLTTRGTWSLPESKLHINYLELKVVVLP